MAQVSCMVPDGPTSDRVIKLMLQTFVNNRCRSVASQCTIKLAAVDQPNNNATGPRQQNHSSILHLLQSVRDQMEQMKNRTEDDPLASSILFQYSESASPAYLQHLLDELEVYHRCMLDLGLTTTRVVRGPAGPHPITVMWSGERLDWNKLKKELVPPPPYLPIVAESFGILNVEYTVIQVLFWIYRKAVVDIMLELACRDVGHAVAGPTECTVTFSGSTNLTSDYDLSVFSDRAGLMILRFDYQFIERFGVESEQGFDTNLYASSFLRMGSSAKTRWLCFPEGSNPQNCMFQYYRVREEAIAQRQRVWASLKLGRWAKQQGEDSDEVSRVAAVCDLVQQLIHATHPDGSSTSMPTRAANRSSMTPGYAPYAVLSSNLDKYFDKSLTQANNMHREKQSLGEIDGVGGEVSQRIKDYVFDNSHGVATADKIALLNYCAPDGYVSCGAMFDVVGGQLCRDSEQKLPVMPRFRIDSVMENLEKAVHNEGIKRSKYLDRVAEAAKKVPDADESSGLGSELLSRLRSVSSKQSNGELLGLSVALLRQTFHAFQLEQVKLFCQLIHSLFPRVEEQVPEEQLTVLQQRRRRSTAQKAFTAKINLKAAMRSKPSSRAASRKRTDAHKRGRNNNALALEDNKDQIEEPTVVVPEGLLNTRAVSKASKRSKKR